MANELSVYGAVPNATELITTMGNAIHQSGLLGCDNPAQGIVFAMTCFAKNSDPMSLAQRYHVIHARLSMRADAMLAEFRLRGGKHKIVKRIADEATIALTMDGDTQEFSFSWADAKGEPFVYSGKESENLRFIAANNQQELAKRLKSKYATPRARMQMLWARVVSDGVRAMCPEVNLGTYTPEEIDDLDETQASSPAVAAVGTAAPPVASPGNNVIDAEFTPADPDAGKITGKQLSRISELFKALGMDPVKQAASAKKRGAESVATLTEEQAGDLLSSLEAAYAKKLGSDVGDSQADGDATSEPVDSPISQQTIDQIKSILRQLVQMPGNADIPEKVKEKLTKHGLKGWSSLTEPAGQQVLNALATKNIESFFQMDLEAAAAKNG